MKHPDASIMTVETELRVPAASIQIVRFNLEGPSDYILRREDAYWLDLCLTPRPGDPRASYHDHWGPHRFERLGDIFLVPPRQTMHVKSESGGRQSSIICQLNESAISQWLGEDIDWTARQLEASLDIGSPHIRTLLFRLAEEARHPGFASQTLAELAVGQLAIELSRVCMDIVEGPVAGGLASWRMRLIEERLREVREPPSLAELARLCNVSVRQLTRGFRASHGCSIGDYIAQTRVDHAKRLLATDETIKAIAYALGFASPSNFSYAFRRATGATPRQYRQRVLRVSQDDAQAKPPQTEGLVA